MMHAPKRTRLGLENISVRARLLIIILFVGGSFGVLAISWTKETRNQLDRLNTQAQDDKKELIQRILHLKAEQLLNVTYNYSYLDGLYTLIRDSKNKDIESIVNSLIEGQRIDAAWVLKKDHSVLVNRFRNVGINVKLDAEAALSISHRLKSVCWYQKEGSDIWEMYGTTLHKSGDAGHYGEFFGYLIIARRLGVDYMVNLNQLSQCQVTIASSKQGKTSSKYAFNTPLRDARGHIVAVLHAHVDDPRGELLVLSAQQAGMVMGGLALVASLTLGFALLCWIGMPIRQLAYSLEKRSPRELAPLMAQKTEFGALARLTHEFFVQERVLVEARDQLERRVVERTQELAHQAFHDALTGLPNRVLFCKFLDTLLEEARRRSDGLAVLFVDIDNFKVINDSLGHEAGDQVLCQVAERMVKSLRTSDTVARISGDEFAVLLPMVETSEKAIQVARSIQEAFQAPLQFQESLLFVTVSMGAALLTGAETAADLLRNADTAMYVTKSQGKASVSVFDSSMKQKADRRLELELGLRKALSEGGGEFSVAFQPIFALIDGELMGMEALLRWNHPTLGAISPAQFIPIAEEAGLISVLGQRVLRDAATRVAEWSQRYGQELRLNVNLSARQLQDSGIVEEVLTTLQQSGLSPQQLALEVTESVMMRHPELSADRLSRLRAKGVRIAVDDFGTGYSSMAVLAQLPLDSVKIDRSFVHQMEQNPEACAIIKAIIELARALRLQTVAEGIETQQQWDLLRELGSNLGQGYYFSRPLTAEAMELFLKEQLTPLLQKRAA